MVETLTATVSVVKTEITKKIIARYENQLSAFSAAIQIAKEIFPTRFQPSHATMYFGA